MLSYFGLRDGTRDRLRGRGEGAVMVEVGWAARFRFAASIAARGGAEVEFVCSISRSMSLRRANR
jgi:hypothetical protein